MASDILDRVAMVITDTGTGDVTANVLISNRFNTPAEAGAANGRSYWWMLEEGVDYQIFEGIYTSSGTKVSRTTTWQSKIANVHGTADMNLAGNATLRSVTPAEVFALLLRVDKDQSAIFTGPQKTQGRKNIDAASTARTVTRITSGSGTYPTPAGCTSIQIRMVSGGGGGGGSGTSPGNGGAGGNTTFASLTAFGGNGGSGVFGNTGGTPSGGNVANAMGESGGSGISQSTLGGAGGNGGSSALGGGARGVFGGAGDGAAANTGGGGAGGGHLTGTSSGGGGGGSYVEHLIVSPSGTYSYANGAGGSGGTAGSGGLAGGAGGSGVIIVEEFY